MKAEIKRIVEPTGACWFIVESEAGTHHYAFKENQPEDSVWNEERNYKRALEMVKLIESGATKKEEVVYPSPSTPPVREAKNNELSLAYDWWGNLNGENKIKLSDELCPGKKSLGPSDVLFMYQSTHSVREGFDKGELPEKLGLGLQTDDESAQLIAEDGQHIATIEFSPHIKMAEELAKRYNEWPKLVEQLKQLQK